MSQRMTNILGYLTLFAILGAIWVLFGEDPSKDQGGRGEPTFKGMMQSVNETASVVLKASNTAVTLQKETTGWTIAERAGYPADREKVVAFLRGIARSERREPKTANVDRFDQIGLGEEAVAVSLLDATGGSLLAFDMGDHSAVTPDRTLTYIFQESDTRSWLVTGLVEASADPAWWLDGTLLDISAARMKEVRLGGAVLARALGDADYTVANLEEGETSAAAWQLADPARVISSLGFDDVMKLGNPLTDPIATVSAATHDELSLSLDLYTMEDATWVQLSARYDAAARDAGEPGQLPSAPADGAAEADSINATTRGWFFKLSDYDAGILKRVKSDFLTIQEDSAPATP